MFLLNIEMRQQRVGLRRAPLHHGQVWSHRVSMSVLQIEETAMSQPGIGPRDCYPNFPQELAMFLCRKEPRSYFSEDQVHRSVSNVILRFTSCYRK